MRRRSDLARGHGVTLVELILAILLLNVIILTGLSMEMAVRRVLLSTDYEGQLSSEAGSVVTMVTKKINLAIGTATAPFMSTVVTGVFTTYAFQMDTNNNGIWEPGIDQTRGFRYYTSGVNQYRVYLMRNGVEVMLLTNRSMNFAIVPNFTDGSANVTVTLRRDPANAINLTNPEATLVSFGQVRAASLN
jgi:hypothetical protein